VNGITGGNSTTGTISATGLYTAPSTVPSTAAVAVSAISQTDTTKSAFATVALNGNSAIAPLSFSVTPNWANVGTLASQQFTSTVAGTSDTAVSWSVNGIPGGNSTVGTISTSGLYKAPATVPNPALVTVTATNQADPTTSTSVTFAVKPSVYADSLGCVGNGITDDTACIQAATSLAAGTTLVLGSGKNYIITQTLQLPDNLTVEGSSSTLTFAVDGLSEDLKPGNNNILHNLAVVNYGTHPQGSGNSQAPVEVGDFLSGNGVANVMLDKITFDSNRPQGDALLITGNSHHVILHALSIPDNAFISSAVAVHWGGQPSLMRVTLPYDITLDGLSVGGMRFHPTWGAVLDLDGTYNVTARNIHAANVQRGIVISPGDFGDEYTPQAQRGLLGQNISISDAEFDGVALTGIDVDNFSVWGLLFSNLSITTTTGSSSATVSDGSKLQVGQVIALGTVNDRTDQQYQIQAIDGNQVTLDVPAVESVTDVPITGNETREPAVFDHIAVVGTNTPDNVAGLYLQGSGVTVRNSTFSNFGTNGIGFGDWADDNHIENSTVSGNGLSGVWENRLGRAHRNRIANSLIYGNNTGNQNDRATASGLFISSSDWMVEGNTIGTPGDNQAYGIAIDNAARRSVLLNNTIVNAKAAAIMNGHGTHTMYELLTISQGNTGPADIPFTFSPGVPLVDTITADGVITFHDSAAPVDSTYTFKVGDTVINDNHDPATVGVVGWVCTASGTATCKWLSE
jgi:hypothetical protein